MRKQFRSFDDARKFVRTVGLKNQIDWKQFCKSGKNSDYFPSHPDRTYKIQWQGWGDFLGTGTIAPQNREYWSFDKARDYVHKLGLKSQNEWNRYVKTGNLPKEIPINPRDAYKDKGWIDFGDWLGTFTISNQQKSKEYLPWNEAKLLYQKIVKENGITTTKEWIEYVKMHKLPNGLPSYPSDIYSKERIQSKFKKK